MMTCNCGGMLFVINVEEYASEIKNKLSYNRVCDVQCSDCGKIIYSQPYDFGAKLNVVK